MTEVSGVGKALAQRRRVPRKTVLRLVGIDRDRAGVEDAVRRTVLGGSDRRALGSTERGVGEDSGGGLVDLYHSGIQAIDEEPRVMFRKIPR